MHTTESVPSHIHSLLESRGVYPPSLHFLLPTDLTLDGHYGQAWVGVDDKHVFVFTQTPAAQTNGQLPSESATWSIETFNIADIEEVRSVNLTGNGMLVMRTKETEFVLCRYSNTSAKRLGQFAKVVNKLAKGETIDASDLEDPYSEVACPKCGQLYPDQSRKICPKCLDRRSVFRRVLAFVPEYKTQITLIILFMILGVALNSLGPIMNGVVLFDEVLEEGGRYHGRLVEMVLLMAVLQLAALITHIVHARINAQMTAEVVRDLKVRVYAAMQRLSLSFFTNKQTGSLMTRVNDDAMNLQHFFHDGLPFFIVNGLQIAAIISIMLWLNWKLALVLLIPTPAIVLFVNKAYPRLWKIFTRRHMKTRAMNAVLNDTLTGFRVVKAFGREDAEIDRFERRNLDVYDVNLTEGRMKAVLFPTMSMLMSLGGFMVWSLGGAQVLQDVISFGTLWTFIHYLGMLYGPLEFMTHIVDWWTNCMNSAQRIFELLDADSEVPESPNPVRLPNIRGEVEMENVTFEYEANKPVLRDINLHIKPGEMIGLVGHSGAGKSTITNLISRLYDVNEGAIRIDGVDVRHASMHDLRSQIGMVLQEPYLFHGSIAENIAYAKPDATAEDIIRAAKMANAHDFIVKLPNGYDTVIGHRGHSLSGGEKQRVSIARALLHNPRILILDEATASVDTETERNIQEALERLFEGRTTIAIAHRLSTLRNADRLVVIEKGRIVEVGTHAELVKKRGVYFGLLQKQREALKIGVKIA